MPTQFPAAIDNFSNPLPGDKLNAPSHSGQHTNANDAIEAIEARIGVNGATDTATVTGQLAANAAELAAHAAALANKQETLVSGVNIKTVNGVSLLGGGDLPISGGGGTAAWGGISGTLSNQSDLQAALNAKGDKAGANTWTSENTFTGSVRLAQSGGGEGGELLWHDPTNPNDPITQDIATTGVMRFFQGVAPNKGVYIDFNEAQGGAASKLLHAQNVGQYAPTLTGGGASGDWGINITGISQGAKGLIAYNSPVNTIYWGWGSGLVTLQVDGTDMGGNIPILARSLYQQNAPNDLNDAKTNGFYRVNGGFVNTPVASGSAYGQLIVSMNSDSAGQIYITHDTGEIYHRGYNGTNGWLPWKSSVDTTNITNFAPTLTGGGASGTWSIDITGNAAQATRAGEAVPGVRFRSPQTRADYGWGGAQFEAYCNPGSAAKMSSVAFHVQDATNAPQMGYQVHPTNGDNLGFFTSSGDPLLVRSNTDGFVRNQDKIVCQSAVASQVNYLYRLTQAQYDAIANKDPNTWYAIVG